MVTGLKSLWFIRGRKWNLVHKLPGQDVFDVGGLDSRCWETIPRHDGAVVSEEAL